MKGKITFIVLTALFLFGCSQSGNEPDYSQVIPELKGHVNDYADLFNQETRDSLENKLTKYEGSTSTQIVVLTVESMGEETTIEQYSYKIATAWGIGQKDKNNGVLITIAKKEKQFRIEVGYGLEGALPDGSCFYIKEHCFMPEVKAKHPDFDDAIKATVDAIILTIAGEFESVKKEVEKKNNTTWFLITLGIIAFIAGFIGIGADSGIVSGICGAIAYPITWPLFWGFDPVIMFGMAIAGFAICWLARYIVEAWLEGSGGSSGSSFGGGSSGFSGGGFSGGGGSFGGGGCSGSW